MPKIDGLQQNTPEWIIHRIGMVTASRMCDVMAFQKKDKTKELAGRKTYRSEIVVEMLTGRSAEHYVTPAMEAGIENEPLAVAAYEMKYGLELEEGGFWVHDKIDRFGASPDRLIGDVGLLEVKCPTTAVHLDYCLAGVVPDDYKPQMYAQMACTGREWCDFVSYGYAENLPPRMRLFVRRLQRDEKEIAKIEAAVNQFLDEVLEMLQRLGQDDPSELTQVIEASVKEAACQS